MSSSFKPPIGKSLAKVDVAKDVQYGDHCVVVEGVVSPRVQGGHPGRDDSYDVHSFELAAWRLLGEPPVDRELTLLRPVPPAILSGKKRDDNIFDRCPAYSVQQLSVLLSKDQTRAVVEKILTSEGPDQELLSFAEALRKPVVICTEHFGNLSLNREFDWFEGKRKWNRRLTDVVFTKSADGSIEDAIKTAETLWADEAGWKQRADDYAVEKLLPLKNASWLEDNDVEVTSNEFKARMKLVSITVEGKGRFTFWHEDGDLFWGHSIEIRGTLEVGLIDADIPG